ncbi:hypothetical protein RHSIM_Rhsim02G0251400 [Rhododendron simsii]|uniref:Homer protein n=1 Tax=Rhododendron simsii TaxID=118357 RepID=A0A834LX45_RHOSS|nr:hypothetical protein RHSIM_Rhsim02G0251400 [Rhododendron simsii]
MTTTTVKPPLIYYYRNPKYPFSIGDKPSLSPSARTKFFTRPTLFPISPTPAVKCSSEKGEVIGGLKEMLSGIVDERVEELLNREENRVLLDGLETASQRVEVAKRALAEIEEQEIEAKKLRDYVNSLESRTSEIAECQREISEAKAMVEEAQRSLYGYEVGNRDAFMEAGTEELDRNAERLESVKAASVSALVGSFAGLPIVLAQMNSNSLLILPFTITFISCALFGVTFRYAVRRDLDNFQLKTGTSAAFAFVKGLATLDGGPPLELEMGSFLSHAVGSAVYVAENLLVFLFAGIALDYCFKMRLLSPFPIRRSASETERR